MTTLKLDARLSAAAALCGDVSGRRAADIGTDHAFLPIHLVQAGAACVLASDINEGPCDRARIHVAQHGLTARIPVVCRPGLEGIEEFAPDVIVIAGMGGEMIADILAASAYPKASGCRLVLQPMTMHGVLRRYLSDGFVITDEVIVREDKRHYQLLAARYDGVKREFTDAQYRLGAMNLRRAAEAPTAADLSWLRFVESGTLTRIRGREAAGLENEEQRCDRALLTTVRGILQGERTNAQG